MSRIDLRSLARAAEGEGKSLARKVRRGQLTRADVEAAAERYPGDIEPVIALQWLDRWGIRR